MRRITLLICLFCVLFPQAGCRSGPQTADASEDSPVNGGDLPESVGERLNREGWNRIVGADLGLWVSVARQCLVGIEGGRVKFVFRCSTAAKGTGNREHSNRTPLGWHRIDEKIGEGLPWGAVLKSRKPTGEVWHAGRRTEKDLVLTRVLWLRGLEPGYNAGRGVDSHDRYIYIHGTPAEELLGTPASKGCVRLSNDQVIQLFDTVDVGTRVLITKW